MKDEGRMRKAHLKSFCVAQNEVNHGAHSVFCRENGWISLSRLAGVSGVAG
jgi:hypothetical protein